MKITNTYKYKMLTHFYIFENLAEEFYLPQIDDENQINNFKDLEKIKINVADIQSFQLLVYPDDKWLSIIKKTRGKLYLDTNIGDDYQEPLWYHEIRQNIELFKRLEGELGNQRRSY